MANGWIRTTEWGDYLDFNSEYGHSYREVDRVQCPHCKELYPTVPYILKANYCPNCGELIK